MTQVLASPTGSAGRVDTGGWVGVLPSLLLMTMSLFLLPSFLIGGLAILGPREMSVRGVLGLVLSLNFLKRLVSRILSGGGGRLVLRSSMGVWRLSIAFSD